MELLDNDFINMLGEWVRAYPGKTINEVKKNQIKITLCNIITKIFSKKTFEQYENDIREIMEKSFPREYKSSKNDKTRKMFMELCECSFGYVSKRNNKKRKVVIYQPVNDISKYIIISFEQNVYNKEFISIADYFFS